MTAGPESLRDERGRRRLGGPGFDVVERAGAAVDRHGMLGPEERVLVAVSGGPDSVCLLDVLSRLARRHGYVIAAAHVNHGLSQESDDVAAGVSTAVAEAGFEIHVIRAPDLDGPNLHARAREFRYRFFETIAARWGATRIATGHTLDDRVETTLARLIHGAGTDGLAGLPPSQGRRIRPLVDIRRSETRAYCDAVGLNYYEDPANEDERFERVVIRRHVVPAIEERWGEGAIRAMGVSADRLAEDAAALAGLADRVYEGVSKTSEEGVSFDLGVILEAPRAFRRRILERAVGRVRDRSGGIEAALDALEQSAGSGAGRFAVASGIEIDIGKDRVVVRRGPEGSPG